MNYIDFRIMIEPVYPRGLNRQCVSSVRKYTDEALPGNLLAENALYTYLSNPRDRHALLSFMDSHSLNHVTVRVSTDNPEFYWCFPVTREEIDLEE